MTDRHVGGPIVFFSYAHIDDQDGAASALRADLEKALRMVTGRRDVTIFQDRDSIEWGQVWEARIETALAGATALIALVSPSFFTSPHCRAEVETFLAVERGLGRTDLVLPLLWVKRPIEELPEQSRDLARLLEKRQYVDWSQLRLKRRQSEQIRRAVDRLANRLADVLRIDPGRTRPDAATEHAPHQPAERAMVPTPRSVEGVSTGMATLTGRQKKLLTAALRDAYPDYERLAMMFGTEMDRSLADYAAPDALPAVLFRVIMRAEAEGWIDELVTAAALGNPGNARLRTIAEELQPQAGSLDTEVDGELHALVHRAAGVPAAARIPVAQGRHRRAVARIDRSDTKGGAPPSSGPVERPEPVPEPRLLRLLDGHPRGVAGMAFSPDGGLLAAGGADATVRLWDPATGTQLHVLRHGACRIACVTFSPDGLLLATSHDDRTVRMWDPEGGMRPPALDGHADVVRAMAFSSDGMLLATGGADSTVRLWDVRTRKLLSCLDGHTSWVHGVAFKPDARILATVGDDQSVRLWDVGRISLLRTLDGHTMGVRAVAFGPDGGLLATAGGDATVRLWNPDTGAPLRVLRGHTGGVHAVAFGPCGGLLATAGEDTTVRLWNPHTGALLHVLNGHDRGVRAVAFHPDSSLLATAGGDTAIRLWR